MIPKDEDERERGTRRRGAELEEALLAAAWEVFLENGYHGFTYEAIASRAGTSRPVLYRRWPQRDELLRATLARYWTPIPLPDTGDLRDDAMQYLRNANEARARTITLLSLQLMDYFRDTGTSISKLRETLRPVGQPSPFEVIVGRAVRRGELPDVPRPSRIVDLPFDLFRHDMLMTLRPISEEAIVEIVDEVWLPLLARGGDRSLEA